MIAAMKKLRSPSSSRPYPLLLFSTCVLLLLMVTFSLRTGLCAEKTAPLEVGGFKLGTSIDDYELISYQNFLKQVVVEDVGEFRKGIIEYGVCQRPGEIVDIKLKYVDTTEAFFDQLLARYKKTLGAPTMYSGDAFGILKAWKWHFTRENGERISLTLQYNLKNPDESIGSVVKLSMPDRIDEERECFNKVCAVRERVKPVPEERDWNFLIPR